jgi:hypothetical protein
MGQKPVFPSLSELRVNSYDNWFSHLASLSEGIILSWDIFKMQNPHNKDIIERVEDRMGLHPTRINMAEANLYPIEEHFYNAISTFYNKQYELYNERLQNRLTGSRINQIIVERRCGSFSKAEQLCKQYHITKASAEACVMYLQGCGPFRKNTLLALKTLNLFARQEGIRFQDAELVFREVISGAC